MARPSTPVRGDMGAAVPSLAAAGPSVLEKTSYPGNFDNQADEQSQGQTQAEETKLQEKQEQEQAKPKQAQVQAQEKQEQEQDVQAQEEQEQKEKTKKAIVWTIKEGEKNKYQIEIQEGDKVKTIVIDKPVVIKEGKGGKVFIITPDGKEVKVLERDSAQLEIRGDKLEVIKGGKVLKVGEDGSSFYVSVNPDIDISKAVKIALKNIPDIDKSVAIALKDLPVTIEKIALAQPYISWVGRHNQEELREKLREVREKLKAVEEKKLELRAVDEALADLEKDLEKMSREMKTIGLKLEDKPVVYTITKKVGEAEAAAEVKVDIAEGARKGTITVVADKKGSFTLSYQIDPGAKGREAYERIVARMKKGLPEGFTLDPKFDEESGRVTLKISGAGDKETPKDLVKKITESIRDETKEKKE
jgi:hypothetical protein